MKARVVRRHFAHRVPDMKRFIMLLALVGLVAVAAKRLRSA